MPCIPALSGISCYMTIYWPPNIRHCDCTMKYWFIKKEWHSLQKNCQENQKNIHWNSVTTSGYGPTDATAELTWPSTTPQWGQNLSEVGFESLFSYFFAFLSWYFIKMFLQVEPKMYQKICIFLVQLLSCIFCFFDNPVAFLSISRFAFLFEIFCKRFVSIREGI